MEPIAYKLEAFEGPLDLLLHLIEKNKVSIYDIPIVQITDQYIEYVSAMPHEDLDLVSDFLVMAATLLDIKARMLLPAEEEDEEEGDPRAELVERLIEYKKYRHLGEELADYEIDGIKVMVHPEDLPAEVKAYRPPVDIDELLGDVTLAKLKSIFDDVMKRREDKIDHERSRFGRIRRQTVNIGDRIRHVRGKLAGGKKQSFRDLLGTDVTKLEVVVTFLAVLELIKTGDLRLTEDSTRDDFILMEGEHHSAEIVSEYAEEI